MLLKRTNFSQNIPIVGIDVSKEKSDFCILDPDNKVFKRGVIKHNEESMKKSMKYFDEVNEQFRKNPICIMEATSYYHRILYNFLVNNGIEVIVINPIQSGSVKNMNIRNMKNDKIDAYRLALLYRLGSLKPSNIPVGETARLRSLCRYHMALNNDLVRHMARLTSFVEQSVPGYEKIFSKLKGSTALMILESYPTPVLMLEADASEMVNIIKKQSHKGIEYAAEKAEQIKRIARSALDIGLKRSEDALLIPSEIAVIRLIQSNIVKTDKEITEIMKNAAFISDMAELLKSIPGISDFSAAVLISEFADISLFDNAKQLVAFCGLEPSQHQSGNFNGTKTKLSKRGSPYLRFIINMIAIKNAYKQRNGKTLNPVLADYYEHKCGQKGKKAALCAVMRKLVHIIFAVLRDKQPFELRTPEEHIEMLRVKNQHMIEKSA